jgi:hypothetical protein
MFLGETIKGTRRSVLLNPYNPILIIHLREGVVGKEGVVGGT